MSDLYRIIERAPTLEEYRELCLAVGWEAYINFDVAAISLQNSLYHVVAVCGEQVVGMGRIIGDGALYFHLQDIAVHPDHQRRGIGKQIMNHLMAYLRDHAPERAFVGLFATAEAVALYRQYGFDAYPELTGMFRTTPIGGP
jgi:ribosomal protein S18 acetylase RimI-like enzyme